MSVSNDIEGSAEWIEEATTIGGTISTLANYGSAQFQHIGGTSAGTPTMKAIELAQGGQVVSYPGQFTGSGTTTGFTASYGTPPPGPAPAIPPVATGPTPSPTPPAPSVPAGYWMTGSDGGVFSFGSAQCYGSTGAMKLQRPIVGMAPTSDFGGYWLVGSDGGAFGLGNGAYFGSVPALGIAPSGTAGAAKTLSAPIVGMVPSLDGGGYFMVGADGGVFAFGDAAYEGSCPAIGGCVGKAVAVMPDSTGNGYWVVTDQGYVYAFGDAPYDGGPGPQYVGGGKNRMLNLVVSAAATTDGEGYWILFADRTVKAYGTATNYGQPTGQAGIAGINPARVIIPTSDQTGYWVVAANGAVYAYGSAQYLGGMNTRNLNGSIIAGAGW